MKNFALLLFVFFICSNAFAQNFIVFCGDTVNRIDFAGKKQGYWIITGSIKKDISYSNEAKVEEGNYKDSQKIGIWISYYPNGNKKYEMTFVKNNPNGHVLTYYEDGHKYEEGIWVARSWRGDYKCYYENDTLMLHFFYDSLGRRQGIKYTYYYNGQLKLSEAMKDGKENGWTREYDESGNLTWETFYVNGIMDYSKSKDYPPIKKSVEQKQDTISICNGGGYNRGVFNGEGNWIIYKNGQITMKGCFHLKKLVNGEHRFYDANGMLIQRKLYKNGEYVGDAPLEREFTNQGWQPPTDN